MSANLLTMTQCLYLALMLLFPAAATSIESSSGTLLNKLTDALTRRALQRWLLDHKQLDDTLAGKTFWSKGRTGTAQSVLGCMDEQGSVVDWWLLLKHPRWSDRAHTKCIGNCDGDMYVYVTSSNPSSWSTGTAPVSSAANSLLGRTLAGVYDRSVQNYVFYNDESPDRNVSMTFGHSKGFFAFDGNSAFWVQHSIPKFPNYRAKGYEFGPGQMWYGQHAFCMTLTPQSLEQIANIMRYAHPQVYDYQLQNTSLPSINAIVARQESRGTVDTIVHVGWTALTLFGKASAVDDDMLDNLASPKLSTTFLSQSWLNIGGPIGGFCTSSGEDVFDILTLKLPGNDKHVTYVDHSKWAVAKQGTNSWWCVLDNNHVESQEIRSGLAVCLQHPKVAALLRDAVVESGHCGKLTPETAGSSLQRCCYGTDEHCRKGQTCCSSRGKSYHSASTCEQYGSRHSCTWNFQESKCMILGGVKSVVAAKSAPFSSSTQTCCSYANERCSKGQVCCSVAGESYKSASTCDQYGSKHKCAWVSHESKCIIPPSIGAPAAYVSKASVAPAAVAVAVAAAAAVAAVLGMRRWVTALQLM